MLSSKYPLIKRLHLTSSLFHYRTSECPQHVSRKSLHLPTHYKRCV
jgi:hypothetical protein